MSEEVSFFAARTASVDSAWMGVLMGLMGKAATHSLGNARSEALVIDGCEKLSDVFDTIVAGEGWM